MRSKCLRKTVKYQHVVHIMALALELAKTAACNCFALSGPVAYIDDTMTGICRLITSLSNRILLGKRNDERFHEGTRDCQWMPQKRHIYTASYYKIKTVLA
eukprot:g47205.t1